MYPLLLLLALGCGEPEAPRVDLRVEIPEQPPGTGPFQRTDLDAAFEDRVIEHLGRRLEVRGEVLGEIVVRGKGKGAALAFGDPRDPEKMRIPEMTVPEGYHLIWGLLSGTFEGAVWFGNWIGASPDGRYASEAVAINLSPSVGMAMKGPTATLRSYANLPLGRLMSGAPLDLCMDGTTLVGDAGLSRLAGFVRSFVELGGGILTISVMDADTMRRAHQSEQVVTPK